VQSELVCLCCQVSERRKQWRDWHKRSDILCDVVAVQWQDMSLNTPTCTDPTWHQHDREGSRCICIIHCNHWRNQQQQRNLQQCWNIFTTNSQCMPKSASILLNALPEYQAETLLSACDIPQCVLKLHMKYETGNMHDSSLPGRALHLLPLAKS